jgi:phosphoribosylamine--glycine ligase
MKILVIGSGGREHALAWKLRQSPHTDRIFCAPGNAGTAEIAENVAIAATYLEALVRFAKENRIDLAVVGPDDPLAAGIVDLFEGFCKGIDVYAENSHRRSANVFRPQRSA